MAHALMRLAATSRTQRLLISIAALIALRFVAGAVLPLSSDEAYYWLWSKHLATGYFDHPPAIAFCIRAGTFLFGDTSLGVRLVPLLLSIVASWFVWRAGAIVLAGEEGGLLACLLFNLTLMIAVETTAATPDAPAIAAASGFLFGLAKLDETQDGRWWLGVGLAAGLGLLSKYTAFFLGLGALAWLAFTPRGRVWLLSPWPYLGALLAIIVFAPNLWWNATHDWRTFAFQFGRIGARQFTLRYIGEFLGAQLMLASPFIFVLAALGLIRATRAGERASLLAAIIWPSVVYFFWHALHDRVQGNWPCFLYPALAIAAAIAMRRTDWTAGLSALARASGLLCIPVAVVLLLGVYAQALFGVVAMGRKDPLARLLAVGFPAVAQKVEAARVAAHAGAILTSDYASTAWLSFYTPQRPTVVQVNEEYRFLGAPRPSDALFRKPLLYVAEARWDRHDLLSAHFRVVAPIARIERQRGGVAIAHYVIYRVDGLRGQAFGRIP